MSSGLPKQCPACKSVRIKAHMIVCAVCWDRVPRAIQQRVTYWWRRRGKGDRLAVAPYERASSEAIAAAVAARRPAQLALELTPAGSGAR